MYKDLTFEMLNEQDYSNYKLCFVERDEDGVEYGSERDPENTDMVLYFTPLDIKNVQWGDDWDDAPYDCNAGIPYDVDGNDNEVVIIRILVTLYPNDEKPLMPADIYYNSMSVAKINSGLMPWLYYEESYKRSDGLPIYAGEDLLTVLNKIKSKLVA